MTEDPINPTLRAELHAALAVMAPQLTGLYILVADAGASPDLLDQYHLQITATTRRQGLILAELAALDTAATELATLMADGYPTWSPVTLVGSLYAEQQEEKAAVKAATAMFTDVTSVGFDPTIKPIDVPQPVPSQ